MSPSSASVLDLDLQPGKPPILQTGEDRDAADWAAEHRETLRAAVLEHGAVLVRGLRLRDAHEIAATFRRLGDLVPEREAFASRRRYGDGVYSSAKWPPNQPMCMH